MNDITPTVQNSLIVQSLGTGLGDDTLDTLIDRVFSPPNLISVIEAKALIDALVSAEMKREDTNGNQ